jgi:peptide/nickel transport system permease protein
MSAVSFIAQHSRVRHLVRKPALVIGTAIVAVTIVVALFASVIAPFDPYAQNTAIRLMPPDAIHWLGTDAFGRDLFSRLLYGSRPTLLLVLLVIVFMAPAGLMIGIVAGYFGGIPERVLMRVTDVVMSFPRLLLAFAFVSLLGAGIFNGGLALALTLWPAYARQARTETARMRASDYLAASEMLGIPRWRLLLFHVLPMVLPSATVRVALDLSGIIIAAAGLGFLGLGVKPPEAEWGSMVAEGTQVVFDQWWIAAAPGAAIFILSLGFNLMADGLRDLMDPRHG